MKYAAHLVSDLHADNMDIIETFESENESHYNNVIGTFFRNGVDEFRTNGVNVYYIENRHQYDIVKFLLTQMK